MGNVVTVQVAEPLMLSTMQHSYAIGPSDMSLFLTIRRNKGRLFSYSVIHIQLYVIQ